MRARHNAVILVVALVVAGGAVWADGARTFSVNWSEQPLSEALGTLKKNFGVNYILPAELGKTRVSANLWDVTPVQALETVVSRAGLKAEERNGTWFISAPERSAASDATAYAQFPGMMAPEMGGMMMGMPGGPNPAAMPGMGMPAPTSPFGTPPGRGTAQPAARQQMGLEYSRPQHFIVIPIFRASPETISYAVQGDDVIYDMGGGGGGGMGGGGGRGGYGGGGGGGGRGGYGGGQQGGGQQRGGQQRGGQQGGGQQRGGGYGGGGYR